ncbi:MAG: SpoIIE family protein phosphatase, partial [Anaerolineae bacterium]|nr:SpoIIE family protein phosphatase [Anaerolineae bacterium]
RSGQVSATLNIVSVDLTTGSLVVSRNSDCPALLLREGRVHLLDAPSEAVGVRPRTRPVITELPLEVGLGAVVFTDGIARAGHLSGGAWDVAGFVQRLLEDGISTARALADALLEEALRLDQHRPRDDMTVAVVWVLPGPVGDKVRRLEIRFPLDSH